MTSLIELLDNNQIAYRLNISIFYCNNSRSQWFNSCRRSNSAIIQTDVFNTIELGVLVLVWQFDNIIDECFNNKNSKKAII